ncbi:MAG: hypothetical protein QNK70_03695 [Crocinitomicaceae bacterium]|tara:strand:- start:357 stop:791 length:435 start_codon:yes stop_codon:yes gene_type:complete
MKNLLSFSLVLGMFVFTACGDSSESASKNASESASEKAESNETTVVEPSGDKSFCDCMEIAKNNPDLDAAPEGCGWLETKTQADMADDMIQALNDCPGLMEEMGMTNDIQEMKDGMAIMNDMPTALEDLESSMEELEEEIEDGM